jgi:uncharacterized damage-inducible protein DinB
MAQHPRELLIDTFAHIPPRDAIDGLSPEDAERKLDGVPHSIAEIVAHMIFWMDWFTRRCSGTPEPIVAKAAPGWPAVERGSWPDLQKRLLDGLERLAAIGEAGGEKPVEPAIDFPPLAQLTIRGAIAHVSTHNAHHLGQVITIRQLIGKWPPPSGAFTW